MRDVKTIGVGDVLHEADAAWLNRLADSLYEEGCYTKGIYLRAMVKHAKITQECECSIKKDVHWWCGDKCPSCAGEFLKNGRVCVCASCLHTWQDSRPPNRPTS